MNTAMENTDWQIIRQIENSYPGLQRILQGLRFNKVFNAKTYYNTRQVGNFNDYAFEIDIGSIFSNGTGGTGAWTQDGRTIHTRNGTLDHIEGLQYSLRDASNAYSMRKWNFTTFLAGGRLNKHFEPIPEERRLPGPVAEPGRIEGSISFVQGNARRILPQLLIQNVGASILDNGEVSDRRLVALIRITDLLEQVDDATLETEIRELERLITLAQANQ